VSEREGKALSHSLTHPSIHPSAPPEIAPAPTSTGDHCEFWDEEASHEHESGYTVARHLEYFFHFQGANAFVSHYGVALINRALAQVYDVKALKSPAGFLHSLVRRMAKE